MSPPEAKLWQLLRRRSQGLKFRHQHPTGPFVVDFYCPEARLIIEVDGMAHEMGQAPARDARRDDWLRERGYRILRIPAEELRTNADGVIQHILNACGR